MQIEVANRVEMPGNSSADPSGDGSHVIAFRSELAHKIAAHFQKALRTSQAPAPFKERRTLWMSPDERMTFVTVYSDLSRVSSRQMLRYAGGRCANGW